MTGFQYEPRPTVDGYGEVFTDKLPLTIDIPGFEGVYYVRQDGTVWRHYKSGDKRVHGYNHKNGLNFHLSYKNKTQAIWMSQIMRRTYFAGIGTDKVLTHRNGDRNDWAIINLMPIGWEEHGRRSQRKAPHIRRVEKVDPVTKEVVDVYRNATEASKHNYLSKHNIIYACNKRSKTRPGVALDGYMYRWVQNK